MKILNAAIIGCGNIGTGFDSPRARTVLTHAHAYTVHPGFRLVGLVDTDYKKALHAAQKWNSKAYRTINDLFLAQDVDVVSVSTTTASHHAVMREITKYKIRGGIVEKPVAEISGKGLDLARLNFFKTKPFLVNYSRRYVPEFRTLKDNIARGYYGAFLCGNGYYGKGLINNGSHLLDLLRYLGFIILHTTPKSHIVDYKKNDPSFSFEIAVSHKNLISIHAVSAEQYSIFEIDLLFGKRRIRITESGLYIKEYVIKRDPSFKEYKSFRLQKIIKTSLNRANYFIVNNLYRTITAQEEILCTIKDALATQKLCEKIQKQKK